MIWRMQVVSDTSPVSNLAIIGRLELLRRLHAEVIIAPAAADELARLRHTEGRTAVESALAAGWLRIAPLPLALATIPGLHAGEMESIALALAEPGTLLLMDESEGRAAARTRGIALSGAVGVLIAARKKGWIPAVKPELLALRSQARFFLSAKFFAEVLAAVGETP